MLRLDRKRYSIALYYNYSNQYADIVAPDITDLCRDLSWSVYRNAAVGTGQITFTIDLNELIARYRAQVYALDLPEILKEQAVRDIAKWLITPSTKTICAVNVQNEPGADVIPVARGYLARAPELQANGDVYDAVYTFTALEGWLAMLPPGGASGSAYTTTAEWTGDYNSNQTTVTGTFDKLAYQQYQDWGFAYIYQQYGRPFTSFSKADGTYSQASYTPATFADSSAILKQLIQSADNDLWIDADRRVCISPHRGSTTKKYIRYPGRLDSTQADEMQCFTPPTYSQPYEPATVVYALGKTTTQKDAASDTTLNSRTMYTNATNKDTLNAAGYFVSTLDNAATGAENLAAQAYLKAHATAEPVPSVTLDGSQVDWGSLSVGDDVHVFNTALPDVMPQFEGDFRITSIEVNTDSNHHETIKLNLEDPTAGAYAVATASGTIRALKQFMRYYKR